MNTETVQAPADPSDILAIAQTIRETRQMKLEAEAKRSLMPRSSVWASQIPECARQGVYEFVASDQKKPWSADVQARISTGHWVEEATIAELTEIGRQAGFKPVDQQAHLSAEFAQEYGIHGRTDLRIEWNETRKRYAVEIKKVSSHIFDKIRDGMEGLDDMRGVWFMRKYVRQLMLNIKGHDGDRGFFILASAEAGTWKIIPVLLDNEEVESALQMAKTITGHKNAGTLPDRIPYDHDICGKCSYLHVCLPDIKNDPTVQFREDAELAEELEKIEHLKPFHSEYEKLWKKTKERMKGIRQAIVIPAPGGDFVMSNKIGATTKYKVPDEVKQQYAVKEPTETLKVERLGQAANA